MIVSSVSKVLDYSAGSDYMVPLIKLGLAPAIWEHLKISETGQKTI